MTHSKTAVLTLTASLFLVSSAAGLIAASGHNPKNATQKSDAVIFGEIYDVGQSGEVEGYHPVKMKGFEVFKGNKTELLNRNISIDVTIQVAGTNHSDVSTAADFTEGEEVVVMLEEREDRFYMTTGYATKYEVSGNDTVQLVAPERKNITLAEMEDIVENASASSTDNVSPETKKRGSSTKSGFSITEPLTAVLEAVTNWVL